MAGAVSFSSWISSHYRYENLARVDPRVVLFDWSLKGNKAELNLKPHLNQL